MSGQEEPPASTIPIVSGASTSLPHILPHLPFQPESKPRIPTPIPAKPPGPNDELWGKFKKVDRNPNTYLWNTQPPRPPKGPANGSSALAGAPTAAPPAPPLAAPTTAPPAPPQALQPKKSRSTQSDETLDPSAVAMAFPPHESQYEQLPASPKPAEQLLETPHPLEPKKGQQTAAGDEQMITGPAGGYNATPLYSPKAPSNPSEQAEPSRTAAQATPSVEHWKTTPPTDPSK